MKLNKEQKIIVELINDKKFTVNWIEKFYNENSWKLSDHGKKSTFIYDEFVREVNSFMKAVNGLIKNMLK